MLKSLTLNGIGPAQRMGPIEFAQRLNVITGDNGLGKSFILDIAWWVLTRTWARGNVAHPNATSNEASIEYTHTKQKGVASDKSVFNREAQTWPLKRGRPTIPGVVIYAGSDGNFSCWDPARNYWKEVEVPPETKLTASYDFTADQVWHGLKDEAGTNLCNGLIQDWVKWQLGGDPKFEDLKRVLLALSPSDDEKLVPGKPTRIGFSATEYPSIAMPYGQDVPVVHASAGIRRILALAYMIVWTWSEHNYIAKVTGKNPANEVVLLIDEIESHLHPKWQRRIVPAIAKVMEALHVKKVPIQLMVATHSPLVLASVEPMFDEDQDAVFTLELVDKQATVQHIPWSKQGDATKWLSSEVFGKTNSRSLEAENVIEFAEKFMLGNVDGLPPRLNTKEKLHQELMQVLASTDKFWPRWIVTYEKGSAV